MRAITAYLLAIMYSYSLSLKKSLSIAGLICWAGCSCIQAADRGDIVDRNGAVLATRNRENSHSESAAHLIGHCVPWDGKLVGETGIEKLAAAALAGGESVKLAIDLRFQKAAFARLKESGLAGAAVVIDPANGNVLAVASYPSYDPGLFAQGIPQDTFNKLARDPNQPLLARATRGDYAPASTFKIFTGLALCRAGLTGAQNCSGTTSIDGRLFSCFKRDGHGDVGALEVGIRTSCNCYFYQAVAALKPADLSELARSFGFGRATGIGIVETTGEFPNPRTGGELANLCIGHGAAKASPLQIANAVAAVANGTTLYKPQLFSGKAPEIVTTLSDAAVTPEHISYIRNAMMQVVEHPRGTGRAARIEGLRIAGKTGTSQGSGDRHIALFAGFAPADAPRHAICVVQEGRSGDASVTGGKTAAPVAARILQDISGQ